MKTVLSPTHPLSPRIGFIICLIIVAVLLLLSGLAYPHMAAELVTRPAGNGHGESSPSREFTALALPVALLLVCVLLVLAPRVNPRILEQLSTGSHLDIKNSIKALNIAMVLIGAIFATLHIGLLALYTGADFPLEAAMGTVFGATLAGLGVLLPLTRTSGSFQHETLERYRKGSSRAYRPASYLLMSAGVIVTCCSWSAPGIAVVVGTASVAVAFGIIAVQGLRAVFS